MHKRILLLSMVIIVLVLNACTPRGIHLFTVEVVGEVREDSILHQPLRGVGIYNTAGEQLGKTDETGHFRVKISVSQGKVLLRFQHPDYTSLVKTLVIDGRSRRWIEIPSLALQPAGAKIRGQVMRKIDLPTPLTMPTPTKGTLKGATIDSEIQVVKGEYHLVTQKGRRWLLDQLGGRGEIRQELSQGVYTIRFLPGGDESQWVQDLRSKAEIEYIEPNRYAYLLGLIPEDERFSDQWNLWMIGIEQAWEYATGNGVTVAVLDSMYTSEHPDLVPHLLPPYDANHDTRPDLYLGAHGTHVSGIIAAAADHQGIIGAAPHARILPIRVFQWSETGREVATVDAIVRGIDYAIAQGVEVINMSFGMRDYDKTLHQAIQRAYAAGIVLVAASGNSGYGQVLYPAAYPEVIAVGAVGPDGKRAGYSQYGPEMELMAPGGNRQLGEQAEVLSTFWDLQQQRYTWAYLQGTSMAAPHVSAIAALLKSYGIQDPDYIRLILRDTARDIGKAGFDEETGYGLVDAMAVLDRFQHTYVFFGEVTSGHAQLQSMVARVLTNGEYEIAGVRPGTGRVVGWIDINHNLIIDSGDYLGLSPEFTITNDADQIDGIRVEMSMVPGEFHAVDLHLSKP